MSQPPIHREYMAFLASLKNRILAAQTRAITSANREMILLYWDIGQGIVHKQQTVGWGESVIEQLSCDLRDAFPDARGYSARNLRDMKRFYLTYSDEAIWPQLVAKFMQAPPALVPASEGVSDPSIVPDAIWPQAVAKLSPKMKFLRRLTAEVPWGHHRLILDKLADPAARLYYLSATARFGWSRNVLLNQIKAGAFERALKEKKTHNFPLALPEHFAQQADEMMKSSYNLEFLGIGRALKERDLENRLIDRLQQFILELGYGFCFVGRQYRLSLGRKEYFVDLLFYHRFLKALVAFDLKVGPFEPEHSGKMDFYLNLLNDKERATGDQPSIGIILCAEKDDVEVEYALKTKANPIGVAPYKLQPDLPARLKGRLPTAKQLADVVRLALPDRK